MPGAHQALLAYGGTGGGSPSGSDIVITGNAEIESSSGDLFSTFSGSLASGVTDAHGRVYDNSSFVVAYTYPGGQEEFVSAGCRFRARTDSTDRVVRFRRVSGAVTHLGLGRVAGGVMRVVLDGPATSFDSAGSVMSLDTWYYAMLYARIHNTSGEFIAKIFDDTGSLLETLTQTGVDTLNAGNTAEVSVWGGANMDTYVDHLWTDITGAFRGAGYVETLSPSAAGDSADWTRGGTDTGNNWDQVNEIPKSTGQYVFSTAADQVDLYNFADRSQAGTPVAVQQIVYARAHTSGTRDYKPICKIGGTIFVGDTFSVTSTTSDEPSTYTWNNNPATGNAWTDSAINSAQFGVKSVTTDVRVQCVALHVLIDIS